MSDNESDNNRGDKVRPIKSVAGEASDAQQESEQLEPCEVKPVPLPTKRLQIRKGIIPEDEFLTFQGQVKIVGVKHVKWKTLVENKLVKVRGYKVWFTPIFDVQVETETAPATNATPELHS